ncbi:MAG: phosphoadenylyl-sulfate reductase [Bacteroidia bacterium]|nr:phosphoadenylyl-sulfate reductase [Bacteroidia bacterium]
MEQLEELEHIFTKYPVEQALQKVAGMFPGKVKFSSSLGQEDQVLTDIIGRHGIAVRIFTIDTGRLFNEAYSTLDLTQSKYRIPIDVYFPQAEPVQRMVAEKGINLFYESVENRKSCCHIRKVEPLNRALEGAEVWITGLRNEQTEHRRDLPVVEWLPEKKMYKINPLLNWSYADITAHLDRYSVPYNPLHDKGFISIGCAPCTRAVSPGEDPRAGRWWWELSHKECGLHLVK